jgi:AcrR family transcriptional regulator
VASTDTRQPADLDADPIKRRRRSPDQARREILDAATQLLRELPAHEVTVIAIMGRTTLSRKSFYVYFRDRAALLAALVAPLRVEADATLRRWSEATDSVPAGRAALRSAAFLYREHGVILRALAEASQRDAEARRVWREVIEPVVAVARQTIANATAAGESHGLDPEPTARALVSMNVHYLFDEVVGKPHADIDAIVATIVAIWERTIYLRQPSSQGSQCGYGA